MALSTVQIIEDGIQEATLVMVDIPKIEAYFALPKDQRTLTALCGVLGIDPAGILGQQFALLDKIEAQIAANATPPKA